MDKKKIITICIIICLIVVMYLLRVKTQKQHIGDSVVQDSSSITEVRIVDKYNKMGKLYENPEEENYIVADIEIDGIYYRNVGIRTKGSGVYNLLKLLNSTDYSYKVKFDYVDKEQQYKRNDRNIFKYTYSRTDRN